MNPNTLHTWISKYSPAVTTAERTDEHLYDELKRLKKEDEEEVISVQVKGVTTLHKEVLGLLKVPISRYEKLKD